MPQNFGNEILTSIYGRRLGLQRATTAIFGGSANAELLVGPDAFRRPFSTAETTSANLKAYGDSILTTANSSGVYTLDPPIKGVSKRLVFHTTGTNPIYVKTAGGETFGTTQATTTSVLASSQTAYAAVEIIGVSSAAWAVVGPLSSGYLRASGTT